MPPSTLAFGLAALFFLPWTSSATTPKALSLNFSKQKLQSREAPQKVRRDDGLSVILDNARAGLFVDVAVGTPPQPVRVLFDTGSADTWIPNGIGGGPLAYNIKDSSSAKPLNSSVVFSYGAGQKTKSTWISDVMHLGGVKLDNMKMGLSKSPKPLMHPLLTPVEGTFGIMGVAPEALELETANYNKTPYANILTELKNNKVINTKAFSLYCNSEEATSGTVLFGAVDSTKYHEPLTALPFATSPLSPQPYYAVQLTSLTAQSRSKIEPFIPTNNTDPLWAVLDSGAPHIMLPRYLIDPLYKNLGATFFPEYNLATVPCNVSTADVTFSFYLGGGPNAVKINVPIANLVQPSMPATEGAHYADNTSACILQLVPQTTVLTLLGDPFLRSAYVVYDQENKQIAIAQANFSSTAPPNIQEILPGPKGIPGVSDVMTPLPFNTTTLLKDVEQNPKAGSFKEYPKHIAQYLNSVLPNHPKKAQVTAVDSAGALFTSTGFVAPTDGLGDWKSKTSTPTGSTKADASKTPTPTSSAGAPAATTSSAAVIGIKAHSGAVVAAVGVLGSWMML